MTRSSPPLERGTGGKDCLARRAHTTPQAHPLCRVGPVPFPAFRFAQRRLKRIWEGRGTENMGDKGCRCPFLLATCPPPRYPETKFEMRFVSPLPHTPPGKKCSAVRPGRLQRK